MKFWTMCIGILLAMVLTASVLAIPDKNKGIGQKEDLGMPKDHNAITPNLGVISCDALSNYAECLSLDAFNDGNQKTIGTILDKSGAVTLSIEPANLPSGPVSVSLVIGHSGDRGIEGSLTFEVKSAATGETYCADNGIVLRDKAGIDVVNLAPCGLGSADLDDLEVTLTNGDVGSAQKAYVSVAGLLVE